ncbi:response regulator transcription factor [Streptomyces sp. NPDC006197]|uniref:response regulator transcription factor n=1 Tax=Streptomyces sp. NPDC006197 TaxID=3156685 RepID=UPI0033A3C8EE
MRVLIADGSALMRMGLVRLLADAGAEVVASLDSTSNVVEEVRRTEPQVAIVDLGMRSGADEWIRGVRRIQRSCPETGVLALTDYLDVDQVKELVQNATGGIGYLLKQRVEGIQEILTALEKVSRGQVFLDTELCEAFISGPYGISGGSRLTEREREIIELVSAGMTNHAIGCRLGISDRAVEKHVTSVLTKLGVPQSSTGHRRVLAVLTHLRNTGRMPPTR